MLLLRGAVAYALASGAALAAAETYYVDGSSPVLGDGSSWAQPLVDLQDALAFATEGDTVLVAQGVYLPDKGTGDKLAKFAVAPGGQLVGGYGGSQAPNLKVRDPTMFPTVLSGDLLGNDAP